MPTILKLNNNQIEMVCDLQDVERLVDTYISSEARKYIYEMMDKFKEEQNELRSHIDDQVLKLISQWEEN